MLIPKPKFHRLAQDTIDQLAREGITCTPDEILWLQEMADDVIKSAASDPARFMDFPTPCGNVLLWPLSIGAKQWFQSVASWFEFDGRVYTLAQAFTMAFGRDPGILWSINTRAAAVWKILRWSQNLTCSMAELSRAMEEINAREDWVDIKTPKEEQNEKAGAPPRPKTDWGEILARLNHYYPGHSLAYWLWEISDDVVATLLERTNSFLPVEQQLSREDKSLRKNTNLRLVVKYIRESRGLSISIGQQVEGGGKMDGNDRPDNVDRRQPDEDRGGQENSADKKMTSHKMSGPGNQEGTNESR